MTETAVSPASLPKARYRVPVAPAAALPWAARIQGTGNPILTWAVRDGD
jgi:hypothetical protein